MTLGEFVILWPDKPHYKCFGIIVDKSDIYWTAYAPSLLGTYKTLIYTAEDKILVGTK